MMEGPRHQHLHQELQEPLEEPTPVDIDIWDHRQLKVLLAPLELTELRKPLRHKPRLEIAKCPSNDQTQGCLLSRVIWP